MSGIPREANPITPAVEITLGEKTYQLSFEHADYVIGEYRLRQQGYPVWMLGPQAIRDGFWNDLIATSETETVKVEGFDVPLLSQFDTFKAEALLFVGLTRKNPQLKFDDLMQMITFENQALLGRVVSAAALAIMPIFARTVERTEAAAEAKPPLPTGSGGPLDEPLPRSSSDSPSESSGG